MTRNVKERVKRHRDKDTAVDGEKKYITNEMNREFRKTETIA